MTGELTAEALPQSVLTRRLALRMPAAGDLVVIARLINDPGIARNTGLLRYPYPVISGRRWIKAARAASGPTCHKPYLLTLRSNPRLVAGAIGVSMSKGNIPTIGYWIARRFRRRGFATEASRALIELIFRHSDAAAVGASARTSNLASQRVLEAAGLQRVGQSRIKSVQLGRYVPTFTYRLERASWEKIPKRPSQ